MGALNSMNMKKTIHFLKRNGIRSTACTIMERCAQKQSYAYEEPEQRVLEEQKNYRFAVKTRFSILVPAYETKEIYFREMIDSVLNQTYSEFELIVADASKSDLVEKVIQTYQDKRIVYKRLTENKGISENTNEALKLAAGEYIGLLDHDDLLTKDALFEMAKAIENEKNKGIELQLLYSDEDKCDGEGKTFFEPHRKPKLNVDLLLSNNYVCHFLVMKRERMKALMFDKDYDGAQDFDITLRAAAELLQEEGYEAAQNLVCHLPKVLYHWRCHEDSTAVNPESKMYAYEAGKRAAERFLDRMGWKAEVSHSSHLGFYEIKAEDLFQNLGNIGAIGGKVADRHNRIIGCLWQEGRKPLEGQRLYFGGYMHRASLRQTMDTLDLRCIKVCPELIGVFEEVTGMKYEEDEERGLFSCENYEKTAAEWENLSKAFCEEVRKKGYRLVFYPEYVYKIKRSLM